MSILLDEAQAYENSRDYDCCQIIEGSYTVGDAVYEAYCDGREALLPELMSGNLKIKSATNG